MALSPQTAHSPSLPVAAPVDLVSVTAVLTPADGSAQPPPTEAAAGAECGGDGTAKKPPAAVMSLLEDDLEEPGVLGVAGDWAVPPDAADWSLSSPQHNATRAVQYTRNGVIIVISSSSRLFQGYQKGQRPIELATNKTAKRKNCK